MPGPRSLPGGVGMSYTRRQGVHIPKRGEWVYQRVEVGYVYPKMLKKGTPKCVKGLTLLVSFYRLQRSWGKVIFSEVCVKNFVHRGRGVSRLTPGGMLGGSGRGDPGPHLADVGGLAGAVSRPTP